MKLKSARSMPKYNTIAMNEAINTPAIRWIQNSTRRDSFVTKNLMLTNCPRLKATLAPMKTNHVPRKRTPSSSDQTSEATVLRATTSAMTITVIAARSTMIKASAARLRLLLMRTIAAASLDIGPPWPRRTTAASAGSSPLVDAIAPPGSCRWLRLPGLLQLSDDALDIVRKRREVFRVDRLHRLPEGLEIERARIRDDPATLHCLESRGLEVEHRLVYRRDERRNGVKDRLLLRRRQFFICPRAHGQYVRIEEDRQRIQVLADLIEFARVECADRVLEPVHDACLRRRVQLRKRQCSRGSTQRLVRLDMDRHLHQPDLESFHIFGRPDRPFAIHRRAEHR